MPLYAFVNAAGDVADFEMDPDVVPALGERRKINGRMWRRAVVMPHAYVSGGLGREKQERRIRDVHFVSQSLPRAQKKPDGSWSSPYSKDVEPKTGKPRFASMRAVREAEATSKAIDGRHAVEWDS